MSDTLCTLVEKDGAPNWCDRHERYHAHHYARYAVDPGPRGRKFRAYWDRETDPRAAPVRPAFLRTGPVALTCAHHGERDETTRRCGGCRKFRCLLLDKSVSLDDCMKCGDFKTS